MKILFVGCGNMGSAIARSMLQSGLFVHKDIEVVLPTGSSHRSMVEEQLKLKVHDEYPNKVKWDAILFAVKPRAMSEVLSNYLDTDARTLIISIAAGKSIKFFEKFFPNNPIIRVMPNINLLVGRGASAAACNVKATDTHIDMVRRIFEKAGYLAILQDEKLIDVVVATSGSSPAYYFLFTELLAKIAVESGLPKDIALKLAEEAFIGSALTRDITNKPLESLRAMVTSSKGTTYEALQKFTEDDNLYKLLKSAFTAAIKRSQELSE